MRRLAGAIVAVLLFGSCASGRYFPLGAHDEDSEWDREVESRYSRQLRALGEESICCSNTGRAHIVRFTWLRSFHQPVILRAERTRGKWLLHTKIGGGKGGYSPGRLIVDSTRALSDSEVSELLKLVADDSGFWQLPTELSYDGIVATDGATWIVEVRNDARYHFAYTDQHREPLRTIGLHFIELAGRDFGEVY